MILRVWVAIALAAAVAVVGGLLLVDYLRRPEPHAWSADERAALASLWIGSLGALPSDPSNAVADDPRAAELGQRLFFDERLSRDGTVSCATCHEPERDFQDDLPLAIGVGQTSRRTMPLAGTAFSPWFFWDGRADSQWAQALGPLENPLEHSATRTDLARLIATYYAEAYTALFGALPELEDELRFPAQARPLGNAEQRAAWEAMRPEDRVAVSRVFANMGKTIAAYERGLLHAPTRFDAYVEALLAAQTERLPGLLTADEVAGLRLFIGKAGCIACHNGPLLTNNEFHNTGVPPEPTLAPDLGRATGVELLLADEFNCLGHYSDAAPDECGGLRFLVTDAERLLGAFKTPSLRDVAERPPYMHAGQIASLSAVLAHYNTAPAPALGHGEILALSLAGAELRQLEAFLRTLSAPLATPHELLQPLPTVSGKNRSVHAALTLERRRRRTARRRAGIVALKLTA